MILVAGSANLDFVVRAAHIAAPGETVIGHGLASFPGGKGANQAVACARAGGVATQMLLALGADAHATALEASLQAAGVHLHLVRSPDLATGCAFICVSDEGENAITVAPGANLALRPHDLPDLRGFSHLLLQLETPLATVAAYAQAARAAGVQVVLNAAPAQPLDAGLLQWVDILIVNETELASLAGIRHAPETAEAPEAPEPDDSIAARLQRLPVPCVVVTLGGRGCCVRHPGGYTLQGAFAVTPVDTTGAGDTFCGALCARLSQGDALPAALRFASAAAALACTRAGAQTSIPDHAEVLQLLQQTAPDSPERLLALHHDCGLRAAPTLP